ncbi:DUF924 family protein [Chroococcidiopsis sp. CCMEE 29]|uniref:DUF924 family protein n=1 Tax=Chroococcidiopsis sp. CCMEE 29 TaxID=155894 RepID=UPI0020223E05|nr:DUF924 family protein [Chroococcidiopsis sp. CCMEE 29]
MSRVDEILNFWFGQPDEANYGKQRSFWFTKTREFDREVETLFLSDYEQAVAGQLDYWKRSSRSCLALILLLDQFPRNMFRGTTKAFATDPQALSVAQHAVSKGFDKELLPVQRWFIYLPFEHSENLAHQEQCVELFASLGNDPDSASALDYAIRHKSVIDRFGRFPHRNQILGRASTPEEIEFLNQPGSSF